MLSTGSPGNSVKKAIVPVEKKIGSFFRITNYGRHRVTFCYAPQSFLAIMAQVIRSLYYDLKCRKENCLKKGYFPHEKRLRPEISHTTQ